MQKQIKENILTSLDSFIRLQLIRAQSLETSTQETGCPCRPTQRIPGSGTFSTKNAENRTELPRD